ncbi:MAG TPA: substrate-binding domain-containing protein [Candidatus Brocadiia bacterium]|nr:substrate-binding domain-containing protein [Candidatus Brocadiia bacterium]
MLFRTQTLLPFAAALVVLIASGCRRDDGKLLCHVGEPMRAVMEDIAAQYEQKTGKTVEIACDSSADFVEKIETARTGDACVCHDPFSRRLANKGLSAETWTAASLTPMIAVRKGNPLRIRSVNDLARPDVRFGMTDPDKSALGCVCGILFRKAGIANRIARKTVLPVADAEEAVERIRLGVLDAAVVWDAVITENEKNLDAVDIESRFRPQPGADHVLSCFFGDVDLCVVNVSIAALKYSKRPREAVGFAQFVASPEAREVWIRHGFSVPAGAPVSAVPPRAPSQLQGEPPL